MKRLIFVFFFITIGYSLFSQNIAVSGNTWYKINSKGTFLTKIKAKGPYAEFHSAK